MRNKKGFSLIEMGVVVAIVSLIFLVSLNAAQVMYAAFINKNAKAVNTLAKQEVLNFAGRYKRLPTPEEFDLSIRSNLPVNKDAVLGYRIKADMVSFILPEEYCSYKYRDTGESVFEQYSPFAFAFEYKYKNEAAITEIGAHYELLGVLGCADRIKPSFVTTGLPPIDQNKAVGYLPYEAVIVTKAGAGEDGVRACIELTPIPDDGADLTGKFQTNLTGGCCLYSTAGACRSGSFAYTSDDKNITISMPVGESLGSYDGVRFKVYIRDDNTTDAYSYIAEKEYTVYKR